MPPDALTKTEYARHRGISTAMVSKYARQDRLVLTEDGRVRVEETDRLLAATRDGRGGDRRPEARGAQGAHVEKIESARLRELQARADKAILETGRLAGTLVKRSDVERAGREIGIRIRDTLQNLPDRMASPLAAETNPAAAHRLLAEELRRIAQEIIDGVRSSMERL